MKKLKAFTLLELLIGMIISSIVIAIGYASYNMIYKQYLLYKSYRTELVEFAGLNSELHNNFYNSERVKAKETSLFFEFKNEKEIVFEFNDEFILRKEKESIDTFKVNVLNYKFFLQNESNIIVNAISFDSELLKEMVQLRFEKMYSAEKLIEAEQNIIKE